MQLYFVPFACSLASRITLNEMGEAADYVLVRDRKLPDGSDYHQINPLGYVPALRTRGGDLLTENGAVLQYLGDLKPDSGLLPSQGSAERYRVLQWLNFVGTELHKFVFAPLMNRANAEPVKEFARAQAQQRFDVLSAHLAQREFLADRFSIADAYLLAVLNWIEYAGMSIEPWPVLKAWRERQRARPSIAKAMAEEAPLRKAA